MNVTRCFVAPSLDDGVVLVTLNINLKSTIDDIIFPLVILKIITMPYDQVLFSAVLDNSKIQRSSQIHVIPKDHVTLKNEIAPCHLMPCPPNLDKV